MKIKQLIDEDFCNYKKASMFIGTCFCDWKCCREANIPESVCQNSSLAKAEILTIDNSTLISRYLQNNITSAIVFGGLEPMKQIDEILDFIKELRASGCEDDVVIYTGFYSVEVLSELTDLRKFNNIIVKFGRYIPNRESIFDEVLGITLASDNQKAIKIS